MILTIEILIYLLLIALIGGALYHIHIVKILNACQFEIELNHNNIKRLRDSVYDLNKKLDDKTAYLYGVICDRDDILVNKRFNQIHSQLDSLRTDIHDIHRVLHMDATNLEYQKYSPEKNDGDLE